jgi:cyclohexanecarboxyl-CoA dehydrogenase
MDYGFTEEHELFRSSVRKFVKKEVVPRAREIGKQEEIPHDLWKKVCELGIMSIVASERYGGPTGDATMLGIAAEEIGKADVSLAATLAGNVCSCVLMQSAPEHVQDQWLPAIMRGEKLSCLAVTEAGGGTDPTAIEMTAKKEKDYYTLKGEKTSVSWGMYADVALVLAKTDPQAGPNGISCFLLPLNSAEIVTSRVADMGLKPLSRAALVLDDVRIPKDHLIGQEGEGLSIISRGLEVMRILIALMSLGAAAAVVDETIEYVKQREAFDKPLATFEGVSFNIVEAATVVEAAKALCYRGLWLKDQGLEHLRESAMCKWWCTNVAVDAIHDALVLHGHFGYSTEALIEQRLRDVVGSQLVDGSAEAMKLILVDELLGKDFLPYSSN